MDVDEELKFLKDTRKYIRQKVTRCCNEIQSSVGVSDAIKCN